MTKPGSSLGRREFLHAATGVTASCALSTIAAGQTLPVREGTVRDRLWVFANPVNADYAITGRRSVMSPLEAAVYLGVPNLLMVNEYPRAGREPTHKPFEPPFEQYAYPLKVLKRVARWLREGRIDGIIIYGTAMDLGCRARLARLRGCRLRGRCGPVAATPS